MKWQPTPLFLPGKSHGQRNLVGYSPWGCKESDTTEQHLLYLQMRKLRHREGEKLVPGGIREQKHSLALQTHDIGILTQCGKKKKKENAAQWYPTLCDPMDCRLPGFSVHGISQARIVQWGAIPSSRESSQTRNQTPALQLNSLPAEPLGRPKMET